MIRDFRAGDEPALFRIHDRSRPDELRGSFDPRAFVPLADDPEVDYLRRCRLFVAEQDGAIVGFAGIDEPYLAWLYVDPDHYRKGVGRALLRHCLARLGDDAWTFACGNNDAALRLYESEGFVVESRFEGDNAGYKGPAARLALQPARRGWETPKRTTIADCLRAALDSPITDLQPVGAGAWSSCWGFTRGGDALVARFGNHVDDYEKDRYAVRWSAPHLPIPDVLALGDTPWGGHVCVSRRAFGIPLEQVDRAHGDALLPATIALLTALRDADLSGTQGWGGWDGNGVARFSTWRERLLSVAEDDPTSRTHGWKAKLAAVPEGDAAFAWGMDRLDALARDDVPRGLIHGDLLNRNALADANTVTGVFDWGCGAFGDPLYDVAWFVFWEPWHPGHDVAPLVAACTAAVENADARLSACLLHIGLDHLAYNAFTGDRANLLATAKRMRALTGA